MTTSKRQELYHKEAGAVLELAAARHKDLQCRREETSRSRRTQHAGKDNQQAIKCERIKWKARSPTQHGAWQAW